MTETPKLPAIVDHTAPFVDDKLVRVYRDDAPITNVLTMANATRWLQRHQPMSIDWTVSHEGYSFRELTAADEITHELQPTVDALHVERAQRKGRTQVWVLESRPLSEPVDTAMTRGLFSDKFGAMSAAAANEGIVTDAITWIGVDDDQLFADVDSTRWTILAWPIDKFDGHE